MRGVRAWLPAITAVVLAATTALAQEKSKSVYGLSIPDRVGSLSYRQTARRDGWSTSISTISA
jgi:hypothetical protein